jgi:hypothetical protein
MKRFLLSVIGALDYLPKCFSGMLPGPVTRPRNKERRNLSAAPWDFLFRQFVWLIRKICGRFWVQGDLQVYETERFSAGQSCGSRRLFSCTGLPAG